MIFTITITFPEIRPAPVKSHTPPMGAEKAANSYGRNTGRIRDFYGERVLWALLKKFQKSWKRVDLLNFRLEAALFACGQISYAKRKRCYKTVRYAEAFDILKNKNVKNNLETFKKTTHLIF